MILLLGIRLEVVLARVAISANEEGVPSSFFVLDVFHWALEGAPPALPPIETTLLILNFLSPPLVDDIADVLVAPPGVVIFSIEPLSTLWIALRGPFEAGLSFKGVLSPVGFDESADTGIGPGLNLPRPLVVVEVKFESSAWAAPPGVIMVPLLILRGGFEDFEIAGLGKDAILIVCSLFRRPS